MWTGSVDRFDWLPKTSRFHYAFAQPASRSRGRSGPKRTCPDPHARETAEFNLDDMIQDRAALAAQTVHFDFDSSVVKANEKSRVDAVAAALKNDSAAKLLIEGHCDERGTEEYNRSLGERRALALRESLTALGVDPMRVKTVSFGEDKPVDPGHDESAYKKNRRGEFILLHPK